MPALAAEPMCASTTTGSHWGRSSGGARGNCCCRAWNSDMHRAIAPDQPYFERADPRQNKLDELLLRGGSWMARRATPLQRQSLRRFAVAAEKVATTISDLSDAALLEAATALRARMVRNGMG